MAEIGQDFAGLMERVRGQSQGAARELIDRYGTLIIRVVRQHLSRELRPKFDSVDFVQAVWASFFAMPAERFDFDQPETLGRFLAQVARNKVIEVVRQRLLTLKYDVRREIALAGGIRVGVESLAGREPTPQELAIAREEWQRLLTDRPAHHQQILDSLRQGFSPRQIAEELGLHENSIRRVIRKLKVEKPHE